jgi:hypothetical protein
MSRTNALDVPYLIKATQLCVMKHRGAGHLSVHARLMHTAMFSCSVLLCVRGFQQVTTTCRPRDKLLNVCSNNMP